VSEIAVIPDVDADRVAVVLLLGDGRELRMDLGDSQADGLAAKLAAAAVVVRRARTAVVGADASGRVVKVAGAPLPPGAPVDLGELLARLGAADTQPMGEA
jgi:hypothetical protein